MHQSQVIVFGKCVKRRQDDRIVENNAKVVHEHKRLERYRYFIDEAFDNSKKSLIRCFGSNKRMIIEKV